MASGPTSGWGSPHTAVPGQCLVVVACGSPSFSSIANVKYSGGAPCGTKPAACVVTAISCGLAGSITYDKKVAHSHTKIPGGARKTRARLVRVGVARVLTGCGRAGGGPPPPPHPPTPQAP